LFGTTPTWFFDETVDGLYTHHAVVTDVGFRQRSALVQDVRATVDALDAFLPFDPVVVEELAGSVQRSGCRAVISDIAPLGIAVAERAGLPSVLVESFTWPWLYEPLLAGEPTLRRHAELLAGWFARADVHVQTAPLCLLDASAGLHAPPISRPARATRESVRALLDVGEGERLVLLTMGGVHQSLPFVPRLRSLDGVSFIVTGAPHTRTDGNLRLFRADARLYMPDLVRAADAVVAKAGYGTVAEVWAQGRPLAYITREDSRETGPLRSWIEREINGMEIAGADFGTGDWIERVPGLLDLPASVPPSSGGAPIVARYLAEALDLWPDGAL